MFRHLYLSMFSTLLFGSSSMFRENVRRKNLMTSFYYEWDDINKYKSLLLFAETENPDLLIGEIQKELDNIIILEEDFERIKKVWIANQVMSIDNIEATVDIIYDDMIKYRRVVDDKLELIRKLDFKKLNNLIGNIKFNNKCKVIMLPEKIITKTK